jgi:hypothetical protein
MNMMKMDKKVDLATKLQLLRLHHQLHLKPLLLQLILLLLLLLICLQVTMVLMSQLTSGK